MHMQPWILRHDMCHLQGRQLVCFGNHDPMCCQHHVSGRCLDVLFQQHCFGVVHLRTVWIRVLRECRHVHTVHGIQQHEHTRSKLRCPVCVCARVLLFGICKGLFAMSSEFILRCRFPGRVPE